MVNSEPFENPAPPQRRFSILAAVLSYLVPGLGQIYQGRVAKGILFMVCLYGMFFTGMAMGDWKNVYLPPMDLRARETTVASFPGALRFLAKVLPATILSRPHFMGQFWIGVAAWPAICQYNDMPLPLRDRFPVLHDFDRAPEDENVMNEYLRNSDKTPDLAWVYTVIAGVLNILVIYDALAGPAFGTKAPSGVDGSRPQQEVARA